MIGLSRLKRAIEDLPIGGMQTGDPKVRLKLCDAQLLEVEFNAIIAERDNALAQNAELVAMVEALRQLFPLRVLLGCDDHLNYPIRQYNDVVEQFNKTPTQHLRDRAAEVVKEWIKIGLTPEQYQDFKVSRDGLALQAEAGRAGFVAGFELCQSTMPPPWCALVSVNYHGVAEQYANKVRRGDV
jgi:hypothetical protein